MKRLLLNVAVSATLLGVFLWRTPLDRVWQQLGRLDATTIVAACAISLVAWSLSGLRIWCLLPEFRLRTLLRVTFASLFYATLLPGQLAGDVVKAYQLGRESTRTGHAEAATLVDRVLAFFALFCLGASAALLADGVPPLLRVAMSAAAAAIALCLVILANASLHQALFARALPRGSGRLATFLRHFAIALHECLRRPRRVLANFLLALAFHVLCIAIQIVLGDALGIALTWVQWTIVHAAVSVVVVLPLSVAGIGLREGGYVGALALFGVASSVALSLSFAILALTVFGAAIGAALELQRLHRPAAQAPAAAAASAARRGPDAI